jgi:hypothetical protein
MPYQTCWIIVHKRRSGTKENILRHSASALLAYEALHRELLDSATEPSAIMMYRLSQSGKRELVARTLIRRRL